MWRRTSDQDLQIRIIFEEANAGFHNQPMIKKTKMEKVERLSTLCAHYMERLQPLHDNARFSVHLESLITRGKQPASKRKR
jgi:hypothetical protein